MSFLPELDPRPLQLQAPAGYRPLSLHLGLGPNPFEVVVLEAADAPSSGELKRLHQTRVGGRAASVAVVVLWATGRAGLAARVQDELQIEPELDRAVCERLLAQALALSTRHEAQRYLDATIPQLSSPVPGLRNSGLFATHHLHHGLPEHARWRDATTHARPCLRERGRALIQKLGFAVQGTNGPYDVLVARGTRVAVAVFLDRPDQIEPPMERFDGLSPVSFALAKADHENLDYVVLQAGSKLRVYPVRPSAGAARRGRTETYVELDLDLLSTDHAGYLWMLASADALVQGGTFQAVLDQSTDYAAELGVRLRERVYRDVVPPLAEAIVRARKLRSPSPDKLAETYEMALLVLFRLLFVAYAEDKDLLPLHTSSAYRKRSLKNLAIELQDALDRRREFGNEDFYWNSVQQLWKAVDQGNSNWRVPAYNGGLFAGTEGDRPAGAALAKLTLRDAEFAPALAALLLDETPEGGRGPIDFRSLGVREFGTIYEGLLESELSVADADLAVDPKSSAYRPARAKDTIVVPAGKVYLHNASGARKSTGAYYTKAFAVEHLLEQALEPALADHLARLDVLDERAAADRFFEFRVADIAMGSGHFLVAVVDHVERALSNYLARRPLPGVRDELERLRRSAMEQLGDDWTGEPLEDARLLRRQIARRCIYGVDLNPLAVELSRLSLWIHTFVPGLPLSFLDANLLVGNSLVGIATLEEAAELMQEDSDTLFAESARERIARAREPLAQLGRLAEASRAEVKQARDLHERVRGTIEVESLLFTVLTASRVDEKVRGFLKSHSVATRLYGLDEPANDSFVKAAKRSLEGLRVFHFPIAFPQVFLGSRGGFDVIVGNPPWEEATLEEDAFWARHEPGLRGLNQREQEQRKTALRKERPDLVAEYENELGQADRGRGYLTSGPFPGMGTGDPDVYKAFCWRFWNLVSPEGGRVGVVLPRSALAAKGSSEFRREVFGQATDLDVTMLLNNKNWVFPEVHPQYTIALLAVARGRAADSTIRLHGPYASLERYREGIVREPVRFATKDISGWNDTSSLPLLPGEASATVFAKLRRAPRLDLNAHGQWRARPATDLHATNDKPLMDLQSSEQPDGFWPVMKGESFDLWTPDTGSYYAWADPEPVLAYLQERRVNSASRRTDSAFSEFDRAWIENRETLPCLHPRIAFRDISRSTDTRTVRVALLPPRVFLTNKAPFFLWPRGDKRDEAYLLGVLASRTLDWYARRFVETSMNFFILNPFPIPRPPANDPLRARVIELATVLASQDRRLHPWAREVGMMPSKLATDEREDAVDELDAAVARLYGLDDFDVRHVYETFHEGWDYEDRLRAVLKHFARCKGRA